MLPVTAVPTDEIYERYLQKAIAEGDAYDEQFKEVLEPLPVRTERTRAFLELFKPGIEYFITPLNDVYGPTGYDPNVQALVVSKETLSGADSSTSSSSSDASLRRSEL